MLSNPSGKIFFGDATLGQRQYFGYDLGIGGFQIIPIDSEVRGNGEQAEAFVAIAITKLRRHRSFVLTRRFEAKLRYQ